MKRILLMCAALALAGCNSQSASVQADETAAFKGVCASVGVIQGNVTAGTVHPNADQQKVLNALELSCSTFAATGQVPSDPATIGASVTEVALILAPLLSKKS